MKQIWMGLESIISLDEEKLDGIKIQNECGWNKSGWEKKSKNSPLSLNMQYVHWMWRNIHMRISKVHMAKFERLKKQQS